VQKIIIIIIGSYPPTSLEFNAQFSVDGLKERQNYIHAVDQRLRALDVNQVSKADLSKAVGGRNHVHQILIKDSLLRHR
jgi:hypothetical protein